MSTRSFQQATDQQRHQWPSALYCVMGYCCGQPSVSANLSHRADSSEVSLTHHRDLSSVSSVVAHDRRHRRRSCRPRRPHHRLRKKRCRMMRGNQVGPSEGVQRTLCPSFAELSPRVSFFSLRRVRRVEDDMVCSGGRTENIRVRGDLQKQDIGRGDWGFGFGFGFDFDFDWVLL